MGDTSLSNASAIKDEIIEALSPLILDKFSPLITIFKIIGVILLIYIIFLIIKSLFKWKTSFDIGKIAKNVEEINEKLDILINKIGYIEMRQRTEEEKETEQELKEGEKKKGFFRKLFGKNKEEIEKTKEEKAEKEKEKVGKEETKKLEKDKSIKKKAEKEKIK